jgi:hypothetical protein
MAVTLSCGTYSHIFYVADVEASGRAMTGELNGALDEAEFLAIFPLKGAERARFIGTVKREAEACHDLTFDDVSPRLINRLDIKVERARARADSPFGRPDTTG